MVLFGLFKNQQQRDAELKARVRRGSMRITRYVAQLTKQGDEYAALARRAYELDDQQQFRQLVSGYLQCRETINRWERYIVKLRALELRRNEAEATAEFLSSMNALTSAILNGVKPEEISTLRQDMDAALQRSHELEETLADALDDAVTQVENPLAQQPEFLLSAITNGEKPRDLKATGRGKDSRETEFWTAVERQKQELMNSPGRS